MSIEFNKPNQSELETFIQRELKEISFDSLSIGIEKEISVKPIYAGLTDSPVTTSPFLPYRINFQYFLCPKDQLLQTNLLILQCLENGASGLILDLNNDEYKVSDLNLLLKDVLLEHLHIEFRRINSEAELTHFLSQYPTPLKPSNIAWLDSTSFSSTTTITSHSFIDKAAELLNSISKLSSCYIHIELSGNYFLDICQIRAFKILLSNLILKENIQSSFLIIGDTSIDNKSKTNSENSLLNITTESMSALVAGCEGIWAKPFDFETNKNNQFSQRMSRNIFNILNEESYLNYVNDPGHGSYFIENYTRQIAEKIYQKLN